MARYESVMALRSPRTCPACGKPGIYILERIFLPAWRSIRCRFCGATFLLSWIWRFVLAVVSMFVGVPAMFIAYWVPDPLYRVPALLVLARMLAVGAYQPLVRRHPPTRPVRPNLPG